MQDPLCLGEEFVSEGCAGSCTHVCRPADEQLGRIDLQNLIHRNLLVSAHVSRW